MKNKKLQHTVRKIIQIIQQITSSQPQYSEDEGYFNQNQQQTENNWNSIDQPDNIYQPEFFEPHMNSQQTRQHFPQRQVLDYIDLYQIILWNHKSFQINTKSYQPSRMQKEIPLPYYLQQHEITNLN